MKVKPPYNALYGFVRGQGTLCYAVRDAAGYAPLRWVPADGVRTGLLTRSPARGPAFDSPTHRHV